MTGYLRPSATIAADVLLPSDPALALALAQRLLDKPLMSNHSHGLWGYTGADGQGRPLTIQSTGIGGPSAAAVLGELAAHGVRRAIRVGRCVALEPSLAIGSVVVAADAVGADGTSQALAAAPVPNAELTAALVQAVRPAPGVTVGSVDLLADNAGMGTRVWSDEVPAVVDLETAALLALGVALGLPVACALVVGETANGERCEPDAEQALLDLGDAAAAALAAQAPVRA